MSIRVAILIFNEVEVLDCCGPFEVLATSTAPDGTALHEVLMVAETIQPVRAVGGLLIQPHHTLETCPPVDVLVVPGGRGRRVQVRNPVVMDWVRLRASRAQVTMSVCTGVFLLGHLGLLDGLAVTTHHSALDELEAAFPAVRVRRGERFVDSGKIITAAGISAGIDASLHLVSRLHGRAVAVATSHSMEYPMPE